MEIVTWNVSLFFSPFETEWRLINHDSSLVYMVTHNSLPAPALSTIIDRYLLACVCVCRKVCRGMGEGVLDVYKNVPVQFKISEPIILRLSSLE